MAPPRTRITKHCERCGTPYEVVPYHASRSRFCSAKCRNLAGADAIRKPLPVCPCGKEIAWEHRNTRKYCDKACRALYGGPSGPQKNPDNYVTFNCERCGVEVTRRKSIGNPFRFCSNECSARSNTQRISRLDDVVFESGWEALVYGLCCFHKVAIERFDRADCIPYGKNGWYGPDFVIDGHYVEVKGLEDDDDRGRYAAWMAERGRLVVLDRLRLQTMCHKRSGDGIRSLLSLLSAATVEDLHLPT